MADGPNANAPSRDSATEGLSQLAARILNQMAISAWLPAAALVLMLAFLTQLGVALDSEDVHGWFEIAAAAFGELGSMQAGSFFLLAGAVVVLTMLTQAFTFESIRLLEGYWGTRGPFRWLALLMCKWHRHRVNNLTDRFVDLSRAAWDSADQAVRDEEHDNPEFTDDMLMSLRRTVRQCGEPPELSEDEQEIVDAYEWQGHATPEVLRCRTIVERRLSDYPLPHRVLPTRLGNVLRHHEDAANVKAVETLVEDRFERLPFSLRVSHDEMRGRLDLYCSMTLVWALVAVIALARFTLDRLHGRWIVNEHWTAGLALAGVCALGALISYRAAVASARHYGSLLQQIARYPVVDRAESFEREDTTSAIAVE